MNRVAVELVGTSLPSRHIGLPQFAPFAEPGPWGRFDAKTWEPLRVGRLEEAAV